MDFAIFAIAFTIGKIYNKANNTSKNRIKPSSFDENVLVFVFILILIHKKSGSKNFYGLTSRIVA